MEVNVRQKTVLEVSHEGKILSETIVSSDSPVGILHDAEMLKKAWLVERMVQAQKEDEKAAEAQ